MSNSDLPKSWSEAKRSGSRFYFNGKMCPYGHVSERYTSSGKCVVCAKKQCAERTKSGYFNKRYAENREQIAKQSKDRYRNDPDLRQRVIEQSKQWRAKNKEKVRAIKNTWKSRQKQGDYGGATARELANWLKNQDKNCAWCGVDCADDYQIDHVHPLSKGGRHELDNIVISCPLCNIKKFNKHPDHYMALIGHHIVMRPEALKEMQ